MGSLVAHLMGIARQVAARDAYIAAAESIDFIVKIRILQEVRRVTAIARVEKELRNGRPLIPAESHWFQEFFQ